MNIDNVLDNLSLKFSSGNSVPVQKATITNEEFFIIKNALNSFDFLQHLKNQKAFSEETFGPGIRTKGVIDHIRKELVEIEAKPTDSEEWIDVILLACDGAWRSGATPEQIIELLQHKFNKNQSRVWPDWRTSDPNMAIQHIKYADVYFYHDLEDAWYTIVDVTNQKQIKECIHWSSVKIFAKENGYTLRWAADNSDWANHYCPEELKNKSIIVDDRCDEITALGTRCAGMKGHKHSHAFAVCHDCGNEGHLRCDVNLKTENK